MKSTTITVAILATLSLTACEHKNAFEADIAKQKADAATTTHYVHHSMNVAEANQSTPAPITTKKKAKKKRPTTSPTVLVSVVSLLKEDGSVFGTCDVGSATMKFHTGGDNYKELNTRALTCWNDNNQSLMPGHVQSTSIGNDTSGVFNQDGDGIVIFNHFKEWKYLDDNVNNPNKVRGAGKTVMKGTYTARPPFNGEQFRTL